MPWANSCLFYKRTSRTFPYVNKPNIVPLHVLTLAKNYKLSLVVPNVVIALARTERHIQTEVAYINTYMATEVQNVGAKQDRERATRLNVDTCLIDETTAILILALNGQATSREGRVPVFISYAQHGNSRVMVIVEHIMKGVALVNKSGEWASMVQSIFEFPGSPHGPHQHNSVDCGLYRSWQTTLAQQTGSGIIDTTETILSPFTRTATKDTILRATRVTRSSVAGYDYDDIISDLEAKIQRLSAV
jgi:hypothetical protein